jgi:GNAT superfamily N-acetyltransferase
MAKKRSKDADTNGGFKKARASVARIIGSCYFASMNKTAIKLRDPEPGDLGFIVHQQAALYAKEYGWDWTFEALISQIVADFIREFNPVMERCWIAELDGKIVGSAFVVKQSEQVAKLRMLYVHESMRGQGLGKRLVNECIEFAKAKHYQTIVLWTNDVLTAARHIYETTGFKLLDESSHFSFGHQQKGQNWSLDLTS